jgi:hypothetical protein
MTTYTAFSEYSVHGEECQMKTGRSLHPLRQCLFCMTMLFILPIQHALGEPLKPVSGDLYRGGTHIQFPGTGVVFIIPDNYSGFISPNGDVFVIERENEPGYILVISESEMTPEHMNTMLYQFIPYEGDILLIPTEMPQMENNRFSLAYTGGAGEGAIKGRGMGLLNQDGTGLIMFALGQAQLMEQYERLLIDIADSTSFTP